MSSIKTLLLVFTCSLISLSGFSKNKGEGSKSELKGTKPNVIIWVADDQYLESVGCYGGNPAHTPNIDKLASEGLRFDRAYSTSSICTPSRSALYTGMYPIKNGSHPNHAGLKKDIPSMPAIMKEFGYRTGLVGKDGVHKKPTRPTNTFKWDEKFPMTDKTIEGAHWGDKVADKHREMDYDKINKFIAESDDPFCLFVAASLPHSPELNEIENGLKGYPANNWKADWQFGKYMQMLEDNNKDDNTLVIFVSDNGANIDSSKYTLFEPGVHIPMIAWWPGKIEPNTTTDALVDFTDVMPTIMELAGGTPNDDMDGVSLLPILEGTQAEVRDDIFLSFTCLGVNDVENPYPIRAVISGDYKLIHYLNYQIIHPKGKEGYDKNPEYQLFNLQVDPRERNNLYDDESYAGVRKRMHKVLDKWTREVGDRGMGTEYEAVPMFSDRLHLKYDKK
jgi:uncharacterized sulfatase